MKLYNTAEASVLLKLPRETLNFRANKLQIRRFVKGKRFYNELELESIKNFNKRNDLRLNPKFSPKKIKMIEFYLDNRTTKDISEILEIKESLVVRCINEWIRNYFSINVASKL
jgi:hypothetical protein